MKEISRLLFGPHETIGDAIYEDQYGHRSRVPISTIAIDIIIPIYHDP